MLSHVERTGVTRTKRGERETGAIACIFEKSIFFESIGVVYRVTLSMFVGVVNRSKMSLAIINVRRSMRVRVILRGDDGILRFLDK